MRWWRQSPLARLVATAILLWTAADLTNTSLCALDSDEFDAVAYAAELSPTLNSGTTDRVPSQPGHLDDCFCCSHCVDVPVFVPAVVAESVARREPPRDVTVPRGFGFPLYHPPLT
jgi:hypothetical protein